jgi:hypothetical protein
MDDTFNFESTSAAILLLRCPLLVFRHDRFPSEEPHAPPQVCRETRTFAFKIFECLKRSWDMLEIHQLYQRYSSAAQKSDHEETRNRFN